MSDTRDIPLRERIIFALDVADGDTARAWITRLQPHIGFFKIGLELFISGGMALVKEIASRDHKLMLDLKLYDVPTTVSRALTRLNGCGAHFVTIHGDSAIINAAAQTETDFDLLAVTVLTSLGREGARELTGGAASIEELALRRARLAADAGCAGIVASALEAKALRQRLGDELIIVSPGIRAQAAADDQKRSAGAAQAIAAGADYLVIGRPIRDAKDPLAAVAQFQQQIQEALAGNSGE